MGWEEVADAVIRRRVELGMRTREQLVEASGLSRKTLGEIERAERTSYDPATIATVERALHWRHGAIDLLVDPPAPEPVVDHADLVPPSGLDVEADLVGVQADLDAYRAVLTVTFDAYVDTLRRRFSTLRPDDQRAVLLALYGLVTTGRDLPPYQPRPLPAFPPPEVIVDARPRRSGDTPIRR